MSKDKLLEVAAHFDIGLKAKEKRFKRGCRTYCKVSFSIVGCIYS